MKFILNKRFTILFATLLVFVLAHQTAKAATLYFDPQERVVGINQNFQVGLLIDADKSINAFDVIINIPSDMTVVDSSDGNSIINYWIERPTYDPVKNKLEFSGIIPGGFYGKGGRLLVVTLTARTAGKDIIVYDKATNLILNGPNQTSDTQKLVPLIMTVEKGKGLIANNIPDYDPPESFAPILATSSSVYGGKWALYFQAVDKGSGIYDYAVAEWPYKTTRYDSLPWQTAQSPYLVGDQNLTQYIYVKATDKAGNSHVETVSPSSTISLPTLFWVIIIVVLAIYLSIWILFHHKAKRRRN